MENSIFERLNCEMTEPNEDLSYLAAAVDILYCQLERFEPGLWWDLENNRRRVAHPAIASWLHRYGFKSFCDLSPAALVAFKSSLDKRLNDLQLLKAEAVGTIAP